MGYVFSRGYVYCVCQNIPGATFIQGATLIPESRVYIIVHSIFIAKNMFANLGRFFIGSVQKVSEI